MARSIVCGVDDSQDARRAVTLAADLANRLGLSLVLVHVAAPVVPTAPYPLADASGLLVGPAPMAPYPVPEPEPGELRQADEHADRLLADIAADCGVRDAVSRSEVALDPADGLRRVAEEEGAELLVVGSRGRGPAKSALLGSTSAELVGRAPCPVVVVPREVGARPAEQRP